MARPVLITMSVLAGAQVLTGGAVLTERWPVASGVAVLVVAAVQTGIAFYVQGQVTPTVNVAAQRRDDGRVVTGPAASAVLAGDANVGELASVKVTPPIIAEGL